MKRKSFYGRSELQVFSLISGGHIWMSVVSPTSRFAYKSIRLHWRRFAYMIWVVSPTHLYKCKFTLWPTSCLSYDLSIDRCDLYRIVLVLTNDYKKNVSCATISSSKYWLLGSSAVINEVQYGSFHLPVLQVLWFHLKQPSHWIPCCFAVTGCWHWMQLSAILELIFGKRVFGWRWRDGSRMVINDRMILLN